MTQDANDDGQCMVVSGPLNDKANEPMNTAMTGSELEESMLQLSELVGGHNAVELGSVQCI